VAEVGEYVRNMRASIGMPESQALNGMLNDVILGFWSYIENIRCLMEREFKGNVTNHSQFFLRYGLHF
jgi:hypothetical protein